jgi:hypothetical protein
MPLARHRLSKMKRLIFSSGARRSSATMPEVSLRTSSRRRAAASRSPGPQSKPRRPSKIRANTSPPASTGPTPARGRTAGTQGYDRRDADFECLPHRSSINQRRAVLHDVSRMLAQAQSLSPSAQMSRSDDRSRRGDVGLQPLRMEGRRKGP